MRVLIAVIAVWLSPVALVLAAAVAYTLGQIDWKRFVR